MSVYVDDMYKTSLGRLGQMKMSHMMADSTEELLDMADKLGIDKKWIQYPKTDLEHFDISLAKRKLAVKYGAIELTMRQMAERRRRNGNRVT